MLWGARTARPLPCQPQKSTHSRASVESESCGMMRRGCSKITSVRRVSTAAAKEQVLTSVDNKCPTCGRSFLNLFTLLWSALLKNSVWAKPSKSEACRENPLPLSTPISWQLSLALSCSLAHLLTLSLSLSPVGRFDSCPRARLCMCSMGASRVCRALPLCAERKQPRRPKETSLPGRPAHVSSL